jgi:hypothetical protein
VQNFESEKSSINTAKAFTNVPLAPLNPMVPPTLELQVHNPPVQAVRDVQLAVDAIAPNQVPACWAATRCMRRGLDG